MNEVLTMDQIEARFPEEWVFIVDPDTGPDLKVRSGIVAFHSKDRDEVNRKAMELRPKRCAVFYLGDPLPPDMIAVL